MIAYIVMGDVQSVIETHQKLVLSARGDGDRDQSENIYESNQSILQNLRMVFEKEIYFYGRKNLPQGLLVVEKDMVSMNIKPDISLYNHIMSDFLKKVNVVITMIITSLQIGWYNSILIIHIQLPLLSFLPLE